IRNILHLSSLDDCSSNFFILVKMKIAILYICTGKYDVFWKGFYSSSEKYFLPSHHKEYFVFTDNNISPINERIHIVHQDKLGWPHDTLMRFNMFHSIKERLGCFDFIFF